MSATNRRLNSRANKSANKSSKRASVKSEFVVPPIFQNHENLYKLQKLEQWFKKGNVLSQAANYSVITVKYPDSDGDKSSEYRKALEYIGEYTCDSIIPTEVIRNRVRLLTSDNENAVKSSVKFLYTIIKYGIVRAKQAEIDYGMDMAKAILLDEVMVPCNGLKEALAEAAFNNFGIKAKEAVEKL